MSCMWVLSSTFGHVFVPQIVLKSLNRWQVKTCWGNSAPKRHEEVRSASGKICRLARLPGFLWHEPICRRWSDAATRSPRPAPKIDRPTLSLKTPGDRNGRNDVLCYLFYHFKNWLLQRQNVLGRSSWQSHSVRGTQTSHRSKTSNTHIYI